MEALRRLAEVLALRALHHLAAELGLLGVVQSLAHVQVLLVTHRRDIETQLVLRRLLRHLVHTFVVHLRKVLKLLRLVIELPVLSLHG